MATDLNNLALLYYYQGKHPFAHDAWVDTIGVDLSQIPIIRTVGENDEVKYKRPGKKAGH